MGDLFRRDSAVLSQLKHMREAMPFFLKKGFSSFAIMMFGMTGAFPALPIIDTKQLTDEEKPAESGVAIDHEELCRWQRDFTFFNDLLGEKKAFGEVPPCITEAAVPAAEALPVVVQKDPELTLLVEEMTAGFPIAAMAPAIAEYDREVAALIVGIAKKESNWGKRVPVDAAGADCFNYWGFKGAGARGVAMGHGCFGSPEEAVHAVGNRIAQLVELRKTSEPKNFTIWKCGSSCATHSPESVRKWISDVDLYYRKIVQN
jgi:hypothetical protein